MPLPKHYATTLSVSLPDILFFSLLASVSVKPKYLSKCLIGMPYAASSECHFLPSMVILGEHLGVILSLTKQIGLYSDRFLATYHAHKISYTHAY